MPLACSSQGCQLVMPENRAFDVESGPVGPIHHSILTSIDLNLDLNPRLNLM